MCVGVDEALWIRGMKLLLPLLGEANSSYKVNHKGQSWLAGEEEDV